MTDRDPPVEQKIAERWRDWSRKRPLIEEAQLRARLLDRISEPVRGPRVRFVMAAAAASLLALMIGVQTSRRTEAPVAPAEPLVVHETGDNVVLILREGKEPIYLLTEPTKSSGGGIE